LKTHFFYAAWATLRNQGDLTGPSPARNQLLTQLVTTAVSHYQRGWINREYPKVQPALGESCQGARQDRAGYQETMAKLVKQFPLRSQSDLATSEAFQVTLWWRVIIQPIVEGLALHPTPRRGTFEIHLRSATFDEAEWMKRNARKIFNCSDGQLANAA
jgi:hypothetical protein